MTRAVRLLFREVATLKRPDEASAEMVHMRQKVTEELANTRLSPTIANPDAFGATMLDAVALLLPLEQDRSRVQ